jgi:ankyrin repeat protein
MKKLISALCLAVFAIALPSHAAGIEDAVIAGDVATVEKLIAEGVDVNNKGAMLGLRPLHYAVMASNKAMIELLLAKGANINIKKNDGYTPLHLAVGRGNVAMVELLVAKGADVNVKNNAGDTPLMLAKDDKVRALLAGGK